MISDNILWNQLESLGTEQNRKIYKRHGVGDNQFGISYANLKALVKKIKVNHELALQLWPTGNHDARVLATMIADPAQVADALLDSWVRDLDNYVITDAFTAYVAKTNLAQSKMQDWTPSNEEWMGTAAWNLLGHFALNDSSLPDSYFEPYLNIIERDLHNRKNRVRYAMNNAIIAIGIRNAALEGKALAAAKTIGKVAVNHGQTSCKTPDAAAYIHKVKARKN